MYIEHEGVIYRGPARGVPQEVWRPTEGRFVPYPLAGQPRPVDWGNEIDEAEAMRLTGSAEMVNGMPYRLYDGYDGGREVPQEYVDQLLAGAPAEVRARAEAFAKQRQATEGFSLPPPGPKPIESDPRT